MSIIEMNAGLNALKLAIDLVKGVNATMTNQAISDVKIELQKMLIDVQAGMLAANAAQTAAVRTIEDLEQEIMRLKDWSAEKQRYQLTDVWRGAMTYMPKPGMEGSEPAHWLCANCFNQGRKSFMQFKGQGSEPGSAANRMSNATYGCDGCNGSIIVSYRTRPEYASDTAQG